MFGRRNREPEPAVPAPRRPVPNIDGGLRFAEPGPPAAAMDLREGPAAARPAAILPELQQEFADREWPGGSYCEMLPVAPAPEAASPGSSSFTIPPPPWQDQLEAGNFDLAAALESPPTAPPMNALAELKARDGEAFDAGWASPIPADPLPQPDRPRIPEPDWEAEEAERRERDELECERLAAERRAELLAELLAEAENDQAYPKPKRQATKEENLR